MATRIVIIDEVAETLTTNGEKDDICFQYCEYQYDDGGSDFYYRFIRKGPDGKYKAQRGQCGIPDLSITLRLVIKMMKIKVKLVKTVTDKLDDLLKIFS
jgi:hypothetical protein